MTEQGTTSGAEDAFVRVLNGAKPASQPDPGPLPQRGGLGMHNLYGKRFVTRDDAEPIVCLAEDDSLVASVDFGGARLRELYFRGTSSAGMVYDQQPWIDYFRKLKATPSWP